MFDVHVKRIHEYKRQLMCCMHVIWLYHRIKADSGAKICRCRAFVLIGGKAAPGYVEAKKHIKLINDVAERTSQLGSPPSTADCSSISCANYNVSWAERVIPAADLSEQISLAGKEASGTGNMKFQMNGALTLGTLDGANIEIRQEVGPENFFLFGLDAAEVRRTHRRGIRRQRAYIAAERAPARRCCDLLEEGLFNPDERTAAQPDRPLPTDHADPFLVCADFDELLSTPRNKRPPPSRRSRPHGGRWWPTTSPGSGKFSSDRTISGYAGEIWGIEPHDIVLPSAALDQRRPGDPPGVG